MRVVSEDWDFSSQQANASIPLLRDPVARRQSPSPLTETASRTESPASVNSELKLEEMGLEVFRKVHIQADREDSTTEKSAEETGSKDEFSINAAKSDSHIKGFEFSDYDQDGEEDTWDWAEYDQMQYSSSKGLGISLEDFFGGSR